MATIKVRDSENTGVAKALRQLVLKMKEKGYINDNEFNYLKNLMGDND
jgi:hypothetical protein